MENSYGIEAARAKLGEIADHARSTGQTIALTRHSRTVAVIGPAASVKPGGGTEARLFLGNDYRPVVFPALPRVGETIAAEDPDDGEERVWKVYDVEWTVLSDGETYAAVFADSSINEDDSATTMDTALSQSTITQTEALEKAVRHLGGRWNTERSVTLLYGAGHDVTEKRARQILRDLAAAGLLEKTGPATYHTTEK